MGRVGRYPELVRAGRRAALLVLIGTVGVAATPLRAQVADRIDAFENGLRPAVSVAGEAGERWTVEERMGHWNVPGLSIAVIRDGREVGCVLEDSPC